MSNTTIISNDAVRQKEKSFSCGQLPNTQERAVVNAGIPLTRRTYHGAPLSPSSSVLSGLCRSLIWAKEERHSRSCHCFRGLWTWLGKQQIPSSRLFWDR